MAVGIDDVRDLTAGLPRSYQVFVRGRIKFRVGRIVYLAFSRDETLMGFAFPREEREAALETYPDKFMRPKPADMRYQWLIVRLEAIDEDELRELVLDAWRMVVPNSSCCSRRGASAAAFGRRLIRAQRTAYTSCCTRQRAVSCSIPLLPEVAEPEP